MTSVESNSVLESSSKYDLSDLYTSVDDFELEEQYENALKEFEQLQNEEVDLDEDYLSDTESTVSEFEISEERKKYLVLDDHKINEFQRAVDDLKDVMSSIQFTSKEELENVPTIEEIREDFLKNLGAKSETELKGNENMDKRTLEFLNKLESAEAEIKKTKETEEADFDVISKTIKQLEMRTSVVIRESKESNVENEDEKTEKVELEKKKEENVPPVVEKVDEKEPSEKENSEKVTKNEEVAVKNDTVVSFETKEEMEIIENIEKQKEQRLREIRELKEKHNEKLRRLRVEQKRKMEELKIHEQKVLEEENRRREEWERDEIKRKQKEQIFLMKEEEERVREYLREEERLKVERFRLRHVEKMKKEEEIMRDHILFLKMEEKRKREEERRMKIIEDERKRQETERLKRLERVKARKLEIEKRKKEEEERRRLAHEKEEEAERLRKRKLELVRMKRKKFLKIELTVGNFTTFLQSIVKKRQEFIHEYHRTIRDFRTEQNYKRTIDVEILPKGTANFSKTKLVKLPLKNKAYLVNELLLDDNVLESISHIGVFRNIRRLSVASNSLRSIKGLKDCLFLNDLDVSNNQIEEISSGDLSKCHYLRTLNCSNNLIHGVVDLSSNVFLEKCNLSGNKLTELPKFGRSCLLLKELLISRNQIVTNSNQSYVMFNPSLRVLDVSSNKISSLSFIRACFLLESFNFRNNDVKGLDEFQHIVGFTNLKYVDFRENPVESNPCVVELLLVVIENLEVINERKVVDLKPELNELYLQKYHGSSKREKFLSLNEQDSFIRKHIHLCKKQCFHSANVDKKDLDYQSYSKRKFFLLLSHFLEHLNFAQKNEVKQPDIFVFRNRNLGKKRAKKIIGRVLRMYLRQRNVSKNSAAARIQALVRGYLARKKYSGIIKNRLKVKNDAATKIQALFRGHYVRKMLSIAANIDDLNFELPAINEEIEYPSELSNFETFPSIPRTKIIPFRTAYMQRKYLAEHQQGKSEDSQKQQTALLNNFLGESELNSPKEEKRKFLSPIKKKFLKKDEKPPLAPQRRRKKVSELRKSKTKKNVVETKAEFIKRYMEESGTDNVAEAEMWWKRSRKYRKVQNSSKRKKKLKESGYRFKLFQNKTRDFSDAPVMRKRKKSDKARDYIPSGKLARFAVTPRTQQRNSVLSQVTEVNRNLREMRKSRKDAIPTRRVQRVRHEGSLPFAADKTRSFIVGHGGSKRRR